MPTTFFSLDTTLHLGNKVGRLVRPSTKILEGDSSDILGYSDASVLTAMVPFSTRLQINNISCFSTLSKQKKNEATVWEQSHFRGLQWMEMEAATVSLDSLRHFYAQVPCGSHMQDSATAKTDAS